MPGRSVHAQAPSIPSKAIGPFSSSRRPAPHFDATYYAGGHTTINGEKDQRLENVRVGVTAALSLSRTTR